MTTDRIDQPETCWACLHDAAHDLGDDNECQACCDEAAVEPFVNICTLSDRTIAALRATVEQQTRNLASAEHVIDERSFLIGQRDATIAEQAREIERLGERITELQAACTREIEARRTAERVPLALEYENQRVTIHAQQAEIRRLTADARLGSGLRELVADHFCVVITDDSGAFDVEVHDATGDGFASKRSVGATLDEAVDEARRKVGE